MRLDRANDLLERGYLPLEAVFERLDDGQLYLDQHHDRLAALGGY